MTDGEDIIPELRAIEWEMGDLVQRIEEIRERVRVLHERLEEGGGPPRPTDVEDL